MAYPRASIFIAISLDGFIARADGSIDWLSCVDRPGQDYGFRDFYDSIDTLVIGRKTYETALQFETWPYSGKRCIVITSDTARVPRYHEEFFGGELRLLFKQLATEGTTHVYLDGGTVIAQALKADLVDRVTLSFLPIILGCGTPLAPNVGKDVPLTLIGHRAYESGLVQVTYQVQRNKRSVITSRNITNYE